MSICQEAANELGALCFYKGHRLLFVQLSAQSSGVCVERYRKSIVCIRVLDELSRALSERGLRRCSFSFLSTSQNMLNAEGAVFMNEKAGHCGTKTTAKILYMNRLIAVAIAANEVIAGVKKGKCSRYYFCVTAKRFNVLRRSLETLGKPVG